MAAAESKSKAKEIAGTIRERLKKLGWTQPELAEKLGIKPNSVTKMLGGDSTLAFAKLANLAQILSTTPNDLLGFGRSYQQERLLGAVQGAVQALGHSREEADEIASTVLEIIDRPLDEGSNPQEQARIIANFLVRQYVVQSDRLKITEPVRLECH